MVRVRCPLLSKVADTKHGVSKMFTAIYFALVITYCVYTICEYGLAKIDKKVMTALIFVTFMVFIWK